ncbi:hypothetical protein TNCV_2562571 [Trichonephila clavipes]|uniref:Uncharacterized protein n=1 Tax=Trichonephila clavipes TaxID=2585209 RepID=A0A8X6USU3_TRICX|nr:hypothetical protein TNCV_2562571 [Trichonephila clavipes]
MTGAVTMLRLQIPPHEDQWPNNNPGYELILRHVLLLAYSIFKETPKGETQTLQHSTTLQCRLSKRLNGFLLAWFPNRFVCSYTYTDLSRVEIKIIKMSS